MSAHAIPTTTRAKQMAESLIHLRVPAAIKGRWVRASRAAGMRLTDYIIAATEAYMLKQLTRIAIPDDLVFSDLHLERDPDGSVSFNWAVIERICQASGLPFELLRDGQEDNVATLLTHWYMAHKKHGGAPDLVAEDLIAEALIEEERGQCISHAPGRA